MVLMVAVEARKNLSWLEPKNLQGREPAVFESVDPTLRQVLTGQEYCLISFRMPKPKPIRGARSLRRDEPQFWPAGAESPNDALHPKERPFQSPPCATSGL